MRGRTEMRGLRVDGIRVKDLCAILWGCAKGITENLSRNETDFTVHTGGLVRGGAVEVPPWEVVKAAYRALQGLGLTSQVTVVASWRAAEKVGYERG